jgi:hypothetical protein
MDAANKINQKPTIRLNLTTQTKAAASPLTFHSSLELKVKSMLGMNSVAALSQEIAAKAGILQVRSPVQPVDALGNNRQGQPSPQRSLEAVPPAPPKPMPRGSLLDLRV